MQVAQTLERLEDSGLERLGGTEAKDLGAMLGRSHALRDGDTTLSILQWLEDMPRSDEALFDQALLATLDRLARHGRGDDVAPVARQLARTWRDERAQEREASG